MQRNPILPESVEIFYDNEKKKNCDRCLCCGNVVIHYPESLTKIMVIGLIALYHAGGTSKVSDLPVEDYFPGECSRSTISSFIANFQKLQYFDLVFPSGNRTWTITEFGKRFLLGYQPCPRNIVRRGNQIIEENTLVYIDEFADLEFVKNKNYYEDIVKNQVE